jgi:hypothetical protein
MARTLGVHYIMNKVYKSLAMEGQWLNTFGALSDPFTMLVFGHPKNGKTSFMMMFAKYLTNFGKVFYNSIEEGDSKTIQDAFVRNRMDEIPDGKFMLGDRYFFADMMEKLAKPNSGRFVFIDSRDFINLTCQQFKKLKATFKHKSFIIVCWETAGKPSGKFAKDIEFIVDVVVHVSNFKAYPRSRFGGNQEFVIWDKKPVKGEQLKMMVA